MSTGTDRRHYADCNCASVLTEMHSPCNWEMQFLMIMHMQFTVVEATFKVSVPGNMMGI